MSPVQQQPEPSQQSFSSQSAGTKSGSGNLRLQKRPPNAILQFPSVALEEPVKTTPIDESRPLIPTPNEMPPSRSSRAQSFPFGLPKAGRHTSFFQSRSKSPSTSSQSRPLPPTQLKLDEVRRPESPACDTPRTHRTNSEPMQTPTTPQRPGYLRKAKRNSGSGVMQCGRHSNDWLFGGVSFRATFKGIVRGESEDDEE